MYQPMDDCPKGLREAPCALHGGTLPKLEWGPPGGFYQSADVLDIVPCPDVSNSKFGRCEQCDGLIMTDREERPLRARRL